MPMFKFQVSNMPSTPVEKYSSSDDSTKMSTTPGSLQLSMSPGSCGSNASSKGNNTANNHRWHNRRRQRSAPRNQEKRPYHLPSHVSPPHDKPMTKNDIYFALDCEVSETMLKNGAQFNLSCTMYSHTNCVHFYLYFNSFRWLA